MDFGYYDTEFTVPQSVSVGARGESRGATHNTLRRPKANPIVTSLLPGFTKPTDWDEVTLEGCLIF